eukprot:906037-Alexandrium_andersonii.AAC.2
MMASLTVARAQSQRCPASSTSFFWSAFKSVPKTSQMLVNSAKACEKHGTAHCAQFHTDSARHLPRTRRAAGPEEIATRAGGQRWPGHPGKQREQQCEQTGGGRRARHRG